MKCGRFVPLGALLLAAGTAYGQLDPWVDPSRVLVVYNRDYSDYDLDGIPDSEAVAWYYVLRRGVPTANLLGLNWSVPLDRKHENGYWYTASEWSDFFYDIADQVRQKIENELGPQNIDYIVLCLGVAYRFEAQLQSGENYRRSTPAALVDVFGVGDANYASDDFNPYADNPYFDNDPTQGGRHFNHTDFKFGTNEMYLSTVLEGADAQHLFDSVEGCMYGDMYVQNTAAGYRGIFYVDKRFGGWMAPANAAYPAARGGDSNDSNLSTVPYWLDNMTPAWPYNYEESAGVIGDGVATWATGSVDEGQLADSAPRALFYAGWRQTDPRDPYYGVFEWLPGSVALLLEGSSPLWNLRIPSGDNILQFGTQAMNAGASCAVGRFEGNSAPGAVGYYDDEVYPDIAAWYLLNGHNFAEAVYAGAPHVKNMVFPVGDPIYCPTHAGQDDGSIVEPRVMIGDGPQTNSKMISVYAGTMEGGATELYKFRLDVGATQDSLQTLYDYDDSPRYSIYQRYVVTQLADGTPLQPAQVYWFRAYAMDPSGNVSQAPLSAFSTEGDISYPSLQTQVIDPSSGLDDRYPSSNYPDGLFQNTNPMWLQEGTEDRILYRLDGVSLDPDVLILKAALKVYWNFRYTGNTNPTPVYAYAMQRDWTLSEVCWLRAATGQDWAREGIACGGLTNATPPVLMSVERSYYPVSLPLFEGAGSDQNGDPPTRREIDITGIVREWAAGTTPNYGIVLNNPNDGAGSPLALYADSSGAATQPELHIYWIYEPPTITLSAVPDVSGVDLGATQSVTLTADVTTPSGRTIQSYVWDFGDGSAPVTVNTSASSDVQVHDFGAQGLPYTVTVTVTDDKTNAVATVQVVVTTRPVAMIDIPSAYVLIGDALQLDGSSSYDPDETPIASYAWDFGDGGSDTSATTSHSWTPAGDTDYTVTLTVEDTVGGGAITGSTSIIIHVVDSETKLPPGMTVADVDLKVNVTDDTCLAPWLNVGGVRAPLATPTTPYLDYTITVPLTLQGGANWTLEMFDASGNSSRLSVAIAQTVLP